MCYSLHETRILNDNLLRDRVLVWGGTTSLAMAKAVALFHSVDKARGRGVVSHALEARMGCTFLRTEATFLHWLSQIVLRKADHGAKPPQWDIAPPSFFHMLKWKSRDCHPENPYKNGATSSLF